MGLLEEEEEDAGSVGSRHSRSTPSTQSEHLAELSEAREAGSRLKSPWKNKRLVLVMAAMGCSVFLSALDLTAISTALPTIANELQLDSFVWVGSAYALASTVTFPVYGSLANVFGRRAVLFTAILLFALGSALCGAAKNQAMLISGRTVQGVGGGGIVALTDILVTDLFPLALRGQATSFFGVVWVFASSIGPPIGGAFASSDWRWLFYLNLPLSGIALAVVLFFCNFRFPTMSAKERFMRFDYLGNVLFMVGATGITLTLSWAGHPYAWDSPGVLVPLIAGFAILATLLYIEPRVVEPVIPPILLSNRTSLVGYFTQFLHAFLVLSIIYYLPVYFQVAKEQSPVLSGVHMFPLSFVIAPVAVATGIAVGVTRRYKELNVFAWAMSALGFGLLCLIKADSKSSIWAGLPVIVAIGLGILYTAIIYPIAASLPVTVGAQMQSFVGFSQHFGQVLGVAVGGAILQNDLPKRLPAGAKAKLEGDGEIAYALVEIMNMLSEEDRAQVKTAVTDSLRLIWITMAALSGLGLLSSIWMRALPLREETDERFALKEGSEGATA